jgi:hypothetical protein
VIGRFVDVTASAMQVEVRCEGRVVARHRRCWARHTVTTDPTTKPPPRRCAAPWPLSAYGLMCRSAYEVICR